MRKVADIVRKVALELLEKPKGTRTDIKCDFCEGILVVREGHSKFFGCSNFPKCTSTYGVDSPFQGRVPIPREFVDLAFGDITDNYGDTIFSMDDYPTEIHCSDDM